MEIVWNLLPEPKLTQNSVNLKLVKASNSNAYTNAIHFPDIKIVMS